MDNLTRRHLERLAYVNASRYVKVKGFGGVYRDLEALGLVRRRKRKTTYYRAYTSGVFQNEWVVEISQEGRELLRAFTSTDLALLVRKVDPFAAAEYIRLISSRADLVELLADKNAYVRAFAKIRFRELGKFLDSEEN